VILVDESRTYGYGPKCLRGGSCHMVSDVSHDELHAFALRLGLRRVWFQGDHYDLTNGRRAQALELGAVAVTAREIVVRRIRKDGTQGLPRRSA
jgi:hypothetical protein